MWKCSLFLLWKIYNMWVESLSRLEEEVVRTGKTVRECYQSITKYAWGRKWIFKKEGEVKACQEGSLGGN